MADYRPEKIVQKVFANSDWCKTCLLRSYPELRGRVVVTGFPFDFSVYEPYLRTPKEENLVVFNQRFSIEKLHIIELEAAQRLIAKGYKVQHLSGQPEKELAKQNISLGVLLEQAQEIGLELVFNPTKNDYHRNLAKATFVITTSIADMLPVSLIEAIFLRVIPIAPKAFCFPEFVHQHNLYRPYDLADIVRIIEEKPQRRHKIGQYAQEKVMDKYFAAMELNRAVKKR
ncbi:glycosyltransferase [Bacillota bacterium LX-D]|nr:glycosyltransferase [Bacillota bacterium LX-D]